MPIPISIPRLGWNMEEGVFVEWMKAEADSVLPGDAVFRLEGEKATEEIECLDSGTLHIPATGPKPGDRLAVGTVIGYLLEPGEKPPQIGATERVQPEPTALSVHATSDRAGTPQSMTNESQALAITPRARRHASRLKIDTSQVKGSGRNGRVRERDLAEFSPSPSSANNAIPLTPTRRAIAMRMIESRQSTAPVTLVTQVDATNLVNIREQFKSAAEGAIPSYTDFFVRFAAACLQRHPPLASRWTESGIVPAASIDIGIAVDTDAGLLVPVVRDATSLGLRQLAEQTARLIDRARRGELVAREMHGSCFTITNLGSFGIDAFTPIINSPECAILGIGRIERRPVVEGSQIVGRDLVTLSLTFDHRIVDGAPAARFLQALAACVASPAAWVSS